MPFMLIKPKANFLIKPMNSVHVVVPEFEELNVFLSPEPNRQLGHVLITTPFHEGTHLYHSQNSSSVVTYLQYVERKKDIIHCKF